VHKWSDASSPFSLFFSAQILYGILGTLPAAVVTCLTKLNWSVSSIFRALIPDAGVAGSREARQQDKIKKLGEDE
jgi:hypothetical protein